MVHILKGMFGEVSLTKVAGVFPDKGQADAAAADVLKAPGMAPGQVRVLGSQDARMARRDIFGRSLDPEQRGIFRTLFITHGITGVIGAIVGFSITFGLLLGGLIAIRPDHVWLITAVRSGLKQGKWAVIVHPVDTGQTAAARELLLKSGAEILKTL